MQTHVCRLKLDGDQPSQPNKSYFSKIRPIHFVPSSYRYDKIEGKCIIYNTLDRLHAKRTLALNGKLYLQLKKSEKIKAKATLFFDGQSKPYEKELEIIVNCIVINLNYKDFLKRFLQNN